MTSTGNDALDTACHVLWIGRLALEEFEEGTSRKREEPAERRGGEIYDLFL